MSLKYNRAVMNCKLRYAISPLSIIVFVLGSIAAEPKIGDQADGSLTPAVHIINLIDEDSSIIRSDEFPLLPFSTEKTCGACHNYQKISSGWHFNAGDSTVDDGRPGQPWIYFDAHSGTQMALSFRDWPQVLHPFQVGMSSLDFISRFGRQMPGGGVGENETLQSPDNYMRWQVSGKLETNCLSCHDAEKSHNQAEYAAQVARQNLRWAATASSGFATVSGSAKDLPINYNIYNIIDPDQSKTSAPQVSYRTDRFNEKNEVFFDIVRKVPSENCYFCHSNKIVAAEESERWHTDEDVHIASGMACVDCHRNGLDHNITRGYETQSAELKSLTCEGCHIPSTQAGKPLNGRSGAPTPAHKGIPVNHFEEMACTACHSGAWPQDLNVMVKTSMAHSLGVHGANRSDSTLPHILTPVFLKRNDGKIAPHNQVWPSWWGEKNNETIIPIALDVILPIARSVIGHLDSLGTNNWPLLQDSTILKVLDSLSKSNLLEHQPVYVSAGRINYSDQQGKLINSFHEAAKPYSWPVAHNVRPAAQSIGINGCYDCHNPTAAFTFGSVSSDTPLKMLKSSTIKTISALDKNTAYQYLFASSFYFRTPVKYILMMSVFITLSVLLFYFIRGLQTLLSYLSQSQTKGDK